MIRQCLLAPEVIAKVAGFLRFASVDDLYKFVDLYRLDRVVMQELRYALSTYSHWALDVYVRVNRSFELL